MGEPAYRAKQLFGWLHKKQVGDYGEMSDLPAALREKLAARFPLLPVETVEVLRSKRDGTAKYLFGFSDGNVIESVSMLYRHGRAVCVSSQAGCRMGCRFCASTIGSLKRNLTASEMLAQVYRIGKEEADRVDSVVIMGSGEPLENYDNTLRFIRLLTDPDGAGLSGRGITVSTCGLVPEIRKLADEGLQITLAVSLHAATQEKRRALMPVAARYDLDSLLSACRYYFEKTGRRITFEYALVRGQNDSEEDAAQLAALLSGMNCHVNLIPVNAVEESKLERPDRARVESFHKKLEKCGINGTIRRAMGSDIGGACGQLRHRVLNARSNVGRKEFEKEQR